MTTTTYAPQPTSDTLAPGLDRSGWRPVLSDSLLFARRNLEHIRQIPEKLLDVTMQPVMFVLLFTYVFGGAIVVAGGSYREYIIAGILVQSLCFGMVGPATSIATDMDDGMVDRFRSLPTTSAAYLLGHYLAQLAGLTLAMAISLLTGLVVGWRPQESLPSVLAAFVLLGLFATAMVWVGTWIGLKVRAPDAVMGVAFVVIFPLTFISNAFVPIVSLPSGLQQFALWNPISVMVQAVRQLFGNPVSPLTSSSWPMEHAVPAAFLSCAVILLIAVPASLRRYAVRTNG
jgi:ABC-2 type transport system permease protein